ncbi:MAG TPA: RNA chaperone Hfq [Burkholderiales bacterium]|nr:RNA chaperone Hfq [Burkholderiales bacterium]
MSEGQRRSSPLVHSRTRDVGGRPARTGPPRERRASAGPPAPGTRGKAEPCQTRVLDEWQASAALLEVTLVNGVKIRGTLTSYDPYSIGLQSRGETQIVYKQAILTIMPVAVAAQPSEAPAARRPSIVLKRRARIR